MSFSTVPDFSTFFRVFDRDIPTYNYCKYMYDFHQLYFGPWTMMMVSCCDDLVN